VQAITVQDRAAGTAGLTLSDIPHPHASENDVIVCVHAAGFTPGELGWPSTWTDRAGRDRTPSVPGHELSGVVAEKVGPADGRAIFFVVEPDRFRLADLAERVRSGRPNPIVGAVRPLAEAPAAFVPGHRVPGETIIQVTPGG